MKKFLRLMLITPLIFSSLINSTDTGTTKSEETTETDKPEKTEVKESEKIKKPTKEELEELEHLERDIARLESDLNKAKTNLIYKAVNKKISQAQNRVKEIREKYPEYFAAPEPEGDIL